MTSRDLGRRRVGVDAQQLDLGAGLAEQSLAASMLCVVSGQTVVHSRVGEGQDHDLAAERAQRDPLAELVRQPRSRAPARPPSEEPGSRSGLAAAMPCADPVVLPGAPRLVPAADAQPAAAIPAAASTTARRRVPDRSRRRSVVEQSHDPILPPRSAEVITGAQPPSPDRPAPTAQPQPPAGAGGGELGGPVPCLAAVRVAAAVQHHRVVRQRRGRAERRPPSVRVRFQAGEQR